MIQQSPDRLHACSCKNRSTRTLCERRWAKPTEHQRVVLHWELLSQRRLGLRMPEGFLARHT